MTRLTDRSSDKLVRFFRYQARIEFMAG